MSDLRSVASGTMSREFKAVFTHSRTLHASVERLDREGLSAEVDGVPGESRSQLATRALVILDRAAEAGLAVGMAATASTVTTTVIVGVIVGFSADHQGRACAVVRGRDGQRALVQLEDMVAS